MEKRKLNILQKIINNKIKKNKEILKLLFYKLYFKGIIFSLKLNIQNRGQKKVYIGNIYIKKGCENKIIQKNE